MKVCKSAQYAHVLPSGQAAAPHAQWHALWPSLSPPHATAFRVAHQQRQSASKLSMNTLGGSSAQSTTACRAAVGERATRREAKDVIQDFYAAYNSGDVDAVMALMAPDIAYHDLALYNEPFRGQQAVRSYFEKVTSTVPGDLQFVPEALTAGDSNAVGVRWCAQNTELTGREKSSGFRHVEIEGNEFPFSRGCSFYEVNDDGLITSARDLVESATKPGGAALYALKALAPVVRKLGPRANPGNLPSVPTAGLAMWAFYAGYMWHILLSSSAPGAAAFQQSPEALQAVLNESINFFYVNIGLHAVGISPLPSVASHPVSEAVFNFVIAWSVMLGPLMFADRKAANVPRKWPLWIGTMFITNIFFIVFMALRETMPAPADRPADSPEQEQARLPAVAPAAGWVASAVGIFSIGWAFLARPEYGDLAARLQYAYASLTGDRIFYAFILDAVLYSVWQAALMPPAAGRRRFIPFFGLAHWLVTR